MIGFLNLAAMERIRRLRRDSFVVALVAMVAVLALGVLQGLIVAVVVSVGELLIKASRPSGSVLGRVPGTTAYVALEHAPEARTEPGLLVYRLNAPLLFVNAKRLRNGIRDQIRDAVGWRCGWPGSAPACSGCWSAAAWPTPSAAPHLYRSVEDAAGDVSA